MSSRGRAGVARVAVALAFLCAVGCSSGQGDPGAGESPTRSPSATTSEPAPKQTRLDIGSARPIAASQYQVLESVPLRDGSTSARVVAVGPTGSVLVAETQPGADETISQDALVLKKRGPKGPETRIEAPRRSKPHQVIGAALDERWAVWMETTSNGVDVQPWTLYAYNVKSGRSEELAHSPQVDGGPPPPVPGFTGPTMVGESVYWAQVGGSFGAETVDVYGCRIASCRPTLYAAGAAFPTATNDGLYVVSSTRYAGKKDVPVTKMSVQRVDPATGQRSEVATVGLSPDEEPGGLAASDRNLVWIVGGHPSTAVVLDLRTQTRTEVESESEGLFGFPIATDRYVAWAESSGTSEADIGGYLFDPITQQLSTLGNTAGLYSVDGNGPYLAWQDSKTPSARPQDITSIVVRLR